MYYSPLTTHYLLLTTHYLLLTTHYSLLTTHYSLLTTYYSLLTTYYLLLLQRRVEYRAEQLRSQSREITPPSTSAMLFIEDTFYTLGRRLLTE